MGKTGEVCYMNIEEARKEAEGKIWHFRSCWNCNGAHEHLKNADYIVVCFNCDSMYWKGVQLNNAQQSR
jgi:uncharacterized protein with PIN domain